MLEMLKRILGRRSDRHASTKEVILYTREGCHLCEDADQLLRKYGLSPKLIDIDEDEHLKQEFDCCIPVVKIDGKIRFRGRVNEVLLKRLISRS